MPDTTVLPTSVNDYSPPVTADAATDLPMPTPAPIGAQPTVTPISDLPVSPVTTPSTTTTSTSAGAVTTPSEDIADLNIFDMLGVTDGTPEQREQFLNELQAVIWDDFIEHDTKLLLTEDEQKQLNSILQPDPKSPENQEKAVVYLETLVPDLEEIMLEKALQLKEEMVRERLKAMQEIHRNDAEKNAKLSQVDQMMSANRWKSASDLLNSVR